MKKSIIIVLIAASALIVCILLLSSLGCWHSYKDASCTAASTCRWCGETQGEALGHKWQNPTCTEPATCKVCKATNGSPRAHSWRAATCTEAKYCTSCKKTEGSALGHKANDATCTQSSVCYRCQKTLQTALGHSWQSATCTTPQRCGRCNTTTGNALGHNYQGYECSRCDDKNPRFIKFSQIGDSIYYKVLGVPTSAVEIRSLIHTVSGTTLYFDLDGQKTFDVLGKYNNDKSRFIWKLYDQNGYIVKTGEVATEDLVKGDRFQCRIIIKNIDLTKTYTLKLFPYELFD